MVSAPARREQVAFAADRGLSQRRACAFLSVARSTLGYESKMEARDAPVLEKMRALSKEYPRYGYRRILVFLEKDGHPMSRDRMHRLWKLARLQVPRKRKRRRAQEPQARPEPALERNHVWAYDFLFDVCANGEKLKCLAIIDELTRECLAIVAEGRIRSQQVEETLDRLFQEHGAPRYIRSDNGPEFIAKGLRGWLKDRGVETAFIEPGSLGRTVA